ncbi:hypothetical protein EON80_15445 [bacterium]|nr:MAG: hypothetical protein EON80_15445 [bacterium]
MNAGKVEVRTRLYDNYAFEQSLKKNLSVPTQARVKVMEIIPQTMDVFAGNRIQLLVGFGETTPLTYVLLSVSAEQLAKHEYTVEKRLKFEEDLQGNQMEPLVTFDGANLKDRGGVTFTGFYTQTSARSLMLKDNFESKDAVKISSARRQDALLGMIQTFRNEDESFAFFQSKSNLILMRNRDGKELRDEASIQRSSLLPGSVFNESFFPLVRASARSLSPAIYVDATQLSPQQIYTWVADQSAGLVAPINLSVTVPEGCRAMAPQRWSSSSTYAYQFLCKSGDQWEIRSLPVKSE